MEPDNSQNCVQPTLQLDDDASRSALAALANEANPPIRLDELLDRCMGNVDLAARLIEKCQACFDQELSELQDCEATGDADEVARVAHRLKGAAASLSAHDLCEMFSQIEEHGRNRDLEPIPRCLDQVQAEWARFAGYTNAFLEKIGAK